MSWWEDDPVVETWWQGDPIATEEERDAAAQSFGLLAHARKRMAESPLPDVLATGVGLGASVISPALRLAGQGGKADYVNRFSNAYQQAIREKDPEGVVPPIVQRGLRGVGMTLPTMVVAGAAGGPYAAIAAASGQEANQAVTEAKDAGLEGADLTKYVAGQATVEAVPAALMQRWGLGGLESLVGRPAADAARKGFMDGFRRVGIETIREVPEEIITEVGHSGVDALSGVDPGAMSPDALAEVVADTTVQTLMTMGAVSAPHLIQPLVDKAAEAPQDAPAASPREPDATEEAVREAPPEDAEASEVAPPAPEEIGRPPEPAAADTDTVSVEGRAPKTVEDWASRVQDLATSSGETYVAPQIQIGKKLVKASEIMPRYGLEPVPGKLNYWRPKGAAAEVEESADESTTDTVSVEPEPIAPPKEQPGAAEDVGSIVEGEPPGKTDAPAAAEEPWTPPPLKDKFEISEAGQAEIQVKLAELRERERVIEKDLDELRTTLKKTRRNAHKKRGKLQGEINEKNQALGRIADEAQHFTRQQDLARSEQEMESAPSEAHWLAWAARREEILGYQSDTGSRKQGQHVAYEDRHRTQLSALIKTEARKYDDELNVDEVASVAERAEFDWKYPSARQTIESLVAGEVNRQKEAREGTLRDIEQLPDLNEEEKAPFLERAREAIQRKDWHAQTQKIRKEAVAANKEAEKRRIEQRKREAAEAAKEAEQRRAEQAKAARERKRAIAVEERFWRDLNARAKALKVEKQVVRYGQDNLQKRKIEILDDTWQVEEREPKEGEKRGYSLVHRPTGQSAVTAGNAKDAKAFYVLMQDLGVDLSEVTAEKPMAPEVAAQLKPLVQAWDRGDLGELEQSEPTKGLKAQFLGKVKVPEVDFEADVVLGLAEIGDLAYHTTATTSEPVPAIQTLKALAAEVPEFAYDPVFVVEQKEGEKPRLIYRDGYKFSFPAEFLGFAPAELTPGMRIGINLQDVGIKTKTEREVVAAALKAEGWDVRGTNAKMTATKREPPPPITEKAPPKAERAKRAVKISITGEGRDWTVTEVKRGFKTTAPAEAQAVIDKIRWGQPETDTVSVESGTRAASGVSAQMLPEGAEPGTTDFEARSAPLETEEQPEDPKKRRIEAQPVPMPELLQLVKDLLGHAPSVKKLRRYLGFFETRPGSNWARMVVNAVAAKDEVLLGKVLAHEAGHMIDWLPEHSLARGNVLGRIGSLRKYMKQWLAGKPGGPGPLTEEERKRLRRAAERASKKGAEIEIEEEIVERFEITPEDVINIWNSLEEASNPDLLRYIKRLSAAEKLALVKEAFRGVVPEEVQRFAKEIRRKTGRKIKKTVEKTATPEEIHAKYLELLKEEVRKRQLLSREMIREELIRLTEWWTPFDRRTSSRDYIKYRESSRELYAEALSVFFNSPHELASRAPEFYRGFTAYLGEKPEFLDSFFAVQEILNGGPERVSAMREEIRHNMYLEAEQKILAAEASREDARMHPLRAAHSFLTQYVLDRTSPVKRRAKKSDTEQAKAAFYAADELAYSENRSYVMFRRIKEHVSDPLWEAGIGENEMGDYLLLHRVVDERNEIANPLGYTPTEAGKEIDALRRKLGDDRFELLEEKMREWHDIVFESVEAAVEEGVYSRQVFEQKIKPNKDNYATFAVIKYLEDYIGPGIQNQVGTFEGVANPWDATTMKMVALNRLIESNAAKSRARDFLQSEPLFRDEITKAEMAYRSKEPKKPARPGFEYLTILEDGKAAVYEVPIEIAKSFQRSDIGNVAKFTNILQSGVYKTFHPLYVTFSPGFIAANPFRDLRRTWKGLGSYGGKWNRQLRDELVRRGMTPAEAKQAAQKQKITIGQVVWAFMKARKAATQHLTGLEDATIEEMFEHKALSTPYVDVAAEAGESTQAGRLMEKYGVKEPKQKNHMMPVRILGKIFEAIHREGARQEIAGKLAAWNLTTARMEMAKELGVEIISPQERAHVVRRYAGTPDFKQKGLATPVLNTLWMYSNVKWQGLTADLELAADSGTRAGWWWRTLIGDVAPMIATKTALYGGFGLAVKTLLETIYGEGPDDEEEGLALREKTRRIGSYYLDNYDVIPLGAVHDASGAADRAKAIFLTVPKDDTGKLISRILSNVIDLAMESAGVDTRRGTPGKAAGEIVDTLRDAGLPAFSPPIEIGTKWPQFWAGVNPRDPHFNSEIVPRREWQAGGWPATRKMLAWTESKFGVAGQVSHLVTAPHLGQAFTPGDETTIERVLRLPLGWHRFVRISDRGLDEEEWLQIELEERENARFKLGLPEEARHLTGEFWRSSRLDASKLSRSRMIETQLQKRWYYDHYLPITREMKAVEGETEGDALRGELEKSARHTLRAITLSVASEDPLANKALAGEERKAVERMLAGLAETVAGPKRLAGLKKESRAQVDKAIETLVRMGVSRGEVGDLLMKKLRADARKEGKTPSTATLADWRRALNRRLESGD